MSRHKLTDIQCRMILDELLAGHTIRVVSGKYKKHIIPMEMDKITPEDRRNCVIIFHGDCGTAVSLGRETDDETNI